MRTQLLQQQYQRGVVLFIALMALVVMSLAAVALIRSVDTNTSIAGNLAARQSALSSASRGTESAIGWLDVQAAKKDGSLDNHDDGNGYFATYGNLGLNNLNLDTVTVRRGDAAWTHSALATGDGIASGVESDGKNKIQYIIERMCAATGEPARENEDNSQKCLMGSVEDGGNSNKVQGADGAGAVIEGSQSPIYRITVRVTGPRNTESYTQTYVF